jgi:hypothetical protein
MAFVFSRSGMRKVALCYTVLHESTCLLFVPVQWSNKLVQLLDSFFQVL